jgi:DNA-binding beta-propeller fold protein YncE
MGPSRAAAASTGRSIGLATADLESRVVAVDLRNGQVLRHIATAGYPRSIETVGSQAVVAHAETGVITIVAGTTLAIRHELTGFEEPRYTAAHPDGRLAYVTDAKAGTVLTVDTVRGRVVARTEVGELARHITIDPAGRHLWTALGSKAEQIAVLDITTPRSPRLLHTVRPPLLAHDLGWSPDRRHVWVSSGTDRVVLLYDTRAGAFVRRLTADGPPQHVTFDKTSAYVTSGISGTLRVYDLAGNQRRLARIPEGSYNVQQGEGYVVTAALGHGTLTVLDLAGAVIRSEKIATSSHDACVIRTSL